MTTIDELGAGAGASAMADAAIVAAARADVDLDKIRSVPPGRMRPSRVPSRRWAIAGSVVVAAAAAGWLTVIAVRQDTHRGLAPVAPSTDQTEPPASLTPPTPVSAPSTLPSSGTTTVAVPTSSAATAEPNQTTTAPSPNVIAVSATALPTAFPATAFATVALTGAGPSVPQVAVGDVNVMVIESGSAQVTVVELTQPLDGSVAKLGTGQRTFVLPITPFDIAAGPGDVIYGLVQNDDNSMSIDAVALTGSQAGQIVESNPINPSLFVEAPPGVLGHGPTGIIDRRTGQQLIAYWSAGSSPALGQPAHLITVTETAGALTVHDPDGTHDWNLQIERDRTSPFPTNGEAPVAPSSNGGAIYSTAVGPPIDPHADQRIPRDPVVAVLAQDGTGTWYSLDNGWHVAATDLAGTILTRVVGSNLELAKLDPPQRYDFVDQPTTPNQRVSYATTLPTTLSSANPCTVDDLQFRPSADGAMGTLYGMLDAHNTSQRPCQVQGAPDVEFLDDAGHVVQSTDPTVLAVNAAAPVIVLEPNSWTVAGLGAVGSNICGGNETTQLRITIGSTSTTLGFPLGRPFDPTSCPSTSPATLGALQPQPFGPIPPLVTPDPLTRVDITLDAPATARRGQTLTYDVVMTGQTDGPSIGSVLVDSNCPVYSETVATVTAQYLLYCNSNNGIIISPGQPARFHMQIRIPNDAPIGPTALTWATTEPAGHTATATITIES